MCPNCEKKISLKKSLVILGILSLSLWGVSSLGSDKQERKTLEVKTRNQILTVLKANEELHLSFFKYDGKKIEKNAISLKNKIDSIKDEEISKLLKFSSSKLSDIKAANTKDVNNQNYHLVSMALIHIVNSYDVGSKYNAYSCPMVKKKWVQNSKLMSKIHNPYAGNMPHCGSQDP